MLKVNKKDEPEFFSEFKKKEKPKDWKDLDFEIKRKLKKYMLDNEQRIDNKSYCPYCEIILFSENKDSTEDKEDKECHIEHIKPKNKFGNLTFDYRNFLISCSENKTCGHSKQSIWDDKLFINPVEENPEEYFSYSIRTGKIIPKKENGLDYDKAVKTIEILNLNEDNLCEYRKTYIINIINTIRKLNDDEKIEIINYFDEFPTLKKFLIENIGALKEII